MRAEVVHLGAVGVVVVDDDHHRQPERTTVSSSADPISAPPSPSAATGSRSGRASAAPIAVASPSPIDWYAWVKQKPDSSGTDRNMLG